jgi:prepilin-type N-terminal cleavage/methylation domain-containing protein
MKYQTVLTPNKKNRQGGFTIIELMIATLMFAIVLLLVTFGLLQVTRTYYKGITGAKTQQTSRAVIDQLSRAIQFSGSTITETPGVQTGGSLFAFCIGNQRYSVLIDRQVVDKAPNSSIDQTKHALVVDTVAVCDRNTSPQTLSNPNVSLSDTSRELIPANMRVGKLLVKEITKSGDETKLYDIQVLIISGENDLLAGGDPDNPSDPNYHKQCGSVRAGTQFCAVSNLSTTVQKRIN